MNDQLQNLFKEYFEDQCFTGLTCCISLNGEPIYHEAFGGTGVDHDEKCRTDTLFDLASVTKIITTTLILQLVSQRKLTLFTSLDNCLPSTYVNDNLASVTIKELLTHTSGLISWYPFYTNLPEKNIWNVLNNIKLLHQSDQKVVYSDLNFILLGEVIKLHYQKSLSEIVDQQISSPLQLESLHYQPIPGRTIAATEFGNQIEKQMVTDRHLTFNKWRNVNHPIKGEVNDGNAYYFFGGESGHAGLFSDVKDLVALGELYALNRHPSQMIDRNLLRDSMNEHAPGRGLGWQVSEPFSRNGAGHTGFTGTMIWVNPKLKLSVGLLTNRLNVKNPKNLNEFRRRVIHIIQPYIKKERSYAEKI
ncbi:serine hydrolase [Halobacillus sp. Marseille-Q1614]|uniref:serine hydrolase domain-containing protein n=1 Tax=Halobacillus sp. Marseille-Q1614 TaxID=2709134 RepID=UPI00156F7AE3|nr:serine hydrolase domain-containing protein [Halobacillus sp. Marseille-Q1614]